MGYSSFFVKKNERLYIYLRLIEGYENIKVTNFINLFSIRSVYVLRVSKFNE